MPKIYVIAGEASGDLHGANLMHSLRKASADALTIYGVGGDKMKAAGALDFMDLAHFHATGITAALRQIPNYRKAFAKIVANVQKVRPDVIVMIDNPGFNLHLAKKLHSLGFRLVYYVTPQIWAWAPKRIEKIKRYFAKCLVVFDFEETLFRKNGVPAVWVGHPLRDIPALIPGQHRHEARKAGPYTVALMPGSRRTEVAYLLPIYLEAAAALAGKLNGTRFLLLQSPTLPRAFYEPILKKSKVTVQIIDKNGYDAIAASDLVLVCSGTATLECAMLGAPMIISNKSNLITYLIARAVLRIPYLGLPNIILDAPRFPELLQYDATPAKISAEALNILTDEKRRGQMLRDLETVSKKLGEPGASRRAADEILKLL